MSKSAKLFVAGAILSPLVLKFAWLIIYVVGLIACGWVLIAFLEVLQQEQEVNKADGEPYNRASNGS